MFGFFRKRQSDGAVAEQVTEAVLDQIGISVSEFLEQTAAPAFSEAFDRFWAIAETGSIEQAKADYPAFRDELHALVDAHITFAGTRLKTTIEGAEAIGYDEGVRRILRKGLLQYANSALQSTTRPLGLEFEPFT